MSPPHRPERSSSRCGSRGNRRPSSPASRRRFATSAVRWRRPAAVRSSPVPGPMTASPMRPTCRSRRASSRPARGRGSSSTAGIRLARSTASRWLRCSARSAGRDVRRPSSPRGCWSRAGSPWSTRASWFRAGASWLGSATRSASAGRCTRRRSSSTTSVRGASSSVTRTARIRTDCWARSACSARTGRSRYAESRGQTSCDRVARRPSSRVTPSSCPSGWRAGSRVRQPVDRSRGSEQAAERSARITTELLERRAARAARLHGGPQRWTAPLRGGSGRRHARRARAR